MSIITKEGDEGYTTTGDGHRVSKDDPRMEALGVMDELMAALGIARAAITDRPVKEMLFSIQETLVRLGGDLSGAPSRSVAQVSRNPSWFDALDEPCRLMEKRVRSPGGFTMPGKDPAAAQVHAARATARRFERRLVTLVRGGLLDHPGALAWTNRLSDYLWLLACFLEQQTAQNLARYPLLARK